MNPIIKKNGISFGIALGIFSILVTTLIYVIDYTQFINIWLGLIILTIYIIVGFVLVSKTKKDLNNEITFKEAFTVFFLAGVIGAVLSVLFNILLFNYIDPAAKDSLNDLTLKYTVGMMEKFGAPAAEVDKVRAEMGSVDNYSPASQFKGLLFNIILSSIFAAILGLIFKSKAAYKE
ncbi:DUF4199 domain-containing protein [Flavobacterium microcysteis]|uniref:DUF4199 domain-containing protein n=1 Tax=Flavobacterium microcysteis TaxID=2596891 RepID=A0A501QBE5_9FLAO|nr:DUF4199 domain-containing protein [Flavobacterium microcysteis]TPD69694.1 DUF4199 domain-containing protein [Flavobacterium microcysteis]